MNEIAEIIDIATSLQNKYWNLELPVNPMHFTKALGISVYLIEDYEGEAEYNKEENAIYIDSLLPHRVQRYLIARELGICIIGKLYGNRMTNVKLATVSNNIFALALLVPKSQLDVFVHEGLLVSDLCKKFDVPEWIIQIRLYQCGYI